jgi:hypothetical protein
MGSHKHGTSGHATKSPRARFLEKMEVERTSDRKDKSRIKDPKEKVSDLFSEKRRR